MFIADTFRYCPRCAAEAELSGRDPFRCESCGFLYHFTPVTAVGVIVEDERERVLFIERAKDPGKGKLGLPGGFVDRGETAEEALVREVREEVNLELAGFRYLTSYPNRYLYRGVERPVTDFFYVGTVESFDALRAGDGEVDALEFLRPADVAPERLAFESNRRALEAYLREKS